MVYKRLYLILLILIFFSLKNILYANIIYDKNNIIISELDLSYYKEMHYEKYNESINNSKALKNLVIIKNVINSLKENNKDFLMRIDESIYNEIGKENINSDVILDIIRFFRTKNEFVYDYYYNNFNMSDLENVKKLRQSTGAGFKDCNLALKEANGNLEKAAEILRIKGIAKASKKMTREANEGVVVVSGDINKTSMIEVNCETDFVAKNDNFIDFVKELSEINNSCSSNLEKLNKSKMNNDKTVNENLISLIAKIGEKITIGRSITINNLNSQNFIYQHSIIKDNVSKLGVVVSLEADQKNQEFNSFGKQLSMHIAASNPIAINSEDIKKDIIDKEQALIAEELKNSGKTDEIANKISLGKIKKFKDGNTLMTQDWVMEPKKKVKDIIADMNIPNLIIKEFARIKVGE